MEKVNPEVLGAILIDGVYYDRKTAKYLKLQGNKNTCNNTDKNKKVDDVSNIAYKLQCVCT
jgi:hypothetical protein